MFAEQEPKNIHGPKRGTTPPPKKKRNSPQRKSILIPKTKRSTNTSPHTHPSPPQKNKNNFRSPISIPKQDSVGCWFPQRDVLSPGGGPCIPLQGPDFCSAKGGAPAFSPRRQASAPSMSPSLAWPDITSAPSVCGGTHGPTAAFSQGHVPKDWVEGSLERSNVKKLHMAKKDLRSRPPKTALKSPPEKFHPEKTSSGAKWEARIGGH